MPLAECPRCGKLYSKVSHQGVCPRCTPGEDADFDKLRDTLQNDPNLTADQLADATGIDIGVVRRCIESGRIQNVDSAGRVRCGRCGAPAISLSKKLCEACLNRLSQELAREQAKIQLPNRKDAARGGSGSAAPDRTPRSPRSLEYRNRNS